MLSKMSLVPFAISLMLVAGCASEDPMVDESEVDTELDEGVVGEPAEATGDGSLPDALLPAYCNTVTSWNAAWVELENQVLTLINQKRAAGATCGATYYGPAPALTFHENLRCSARKHSKDMGDNNFFSHTGSNGSAFSQRMTSAGYSWTAAAENIAAGQTTAASVVNSWMTSEGHCKNIMNKTYVHIGTGYYNAPAATYKHYWTQNFGKP